MATVPGCMNPNAVNYNVSANEDDGSCLFLNKVGGQCYAFQEVTGLVDKSFTLSWAVVDNNWVFFHDNIPDFYFSTREQLYNLKGGKIFQHNAGPPGVYHDPSSIKPFFIDVVFNGDNEMTLNTIDWITEVLNADGSIARFDTLTHITVWNSYQCSGKLTLSQVFTDLQQDVRLTVGRWFFDNFRNKVLTDGVAFLNDIFGNFDVKPGATGELPWYEQQLLEDNYFIVRFEFDNTTGKQVFLQDVNINQDPSYR